MNEKHGHDGSMNHVWISPTLDEKVVIKQTLERSREYGPYQLHWHPEAIGCEAKYRHEIVVNGHMTGGVGKALWPGL